jgi:hypothetical protein
MNGGKSIFAQLTDYLPWIQFQECVERYRGDYKLKKFSCWDQFLCMAFAQLTYRESLRDSEACLRANQTSSITWAFGAAFRATRWPTPTRYAIGAFTPTSHKC